MKYRVIITKTKKTSHIMDSDSVLEAEHEAIKECNEGRGESVSDGMRTAVEKVTKG